MYYIYNIKICVRHKALPSFSLFLSFISYDCKDNVFGYTNGYKFPSMVDIEKCSRLKLFGIMKARYLKSCALVDPLSGVSCHASQAARSMIALSLISKQLVYKK